MPMFAWWRDQCRETIDETGRAPRQTVQRWMDGGHLHGWRTPAGHRRVEIASVHELLTTARRAETGGVAAGQSGAGRAADAVTRI